MRLERDEIVRSDFPLERRGYARSAVDAHLESIAAAVAALAAAAGASDAHGAAAAVGDQVGAIVAAAEQAAARIETEAGDRAREHEARAKAAADELIARIDALRAGVERLLEEAAPAPAPAPVPPAASAPPTAPPVPPAASAPPPPAAQRAPSGGPAAAARPDKPRPPMPAPQAERPASNGDPKAVEAARLVALQMLLEGHSRPEVETYLAENFDLPDRGALLDAVAAAAGA